MCGINGIFAYHAAASPPTNSELLATREAMLVRGPDGAGMWWSEDRQCGLANRRLSIQDLSIRAAQPMASPDGAAVVTYNGEIYNCRELRAELARDGVRLRTTGDTEVLLHLYQRHGEAMVSRLRGMYAFAIWDVRRRVLLLARDPYGIKPLYTTDDGWTLKFASQVKALLAGGRVSREGDPAGIVGFHLFGSVPEPFTLYRDIRALPAGHTQLIDARGPQAPRPFVNLSGILAQGVAKPAPGGELQERLRAAVLDSVRAHLLADVEIGLFLSAGVDSSALLGLARDSGENVRAITLAFDEFRGAPEDEVPLARRTAQRYGVPHIVRRVDEREFRDDLPAILEAMDQPSIDGVNTWFVAKAAKEAGLKVALSGLGGDELLAGYSSFAEVPRWHRRFGPFAAVPGLGRMAQAMLEVLAPKFVRARPKAAGLLRYTNRWSGAYLVRRGLFMPYELSEVMDPAAAREGLRRLRPFNSIAAGLVPDPGSDIGRICALETTNYMRNQLLRDADWAGMANSVEIRVPFVDLRLLEAVAPLLPRLQPGSGKTALLSALATPPPADIKIRAKTGFGVPTAAWLDRAVGDGPGNRREKHQEKRPLEGAGHVSREWSSRVLQSFAWQKPSLRGNDEAGDVLIFRIGSIGDTVVALPCFHTIARAFQRSRRVLVTNIPTSHKAATVESMLGPTGLIDEVIYFPEPPRRIADVLSLRARIRRTGSTTLIYIADRKLWPVVRDGVYFRLCGVRRIVGAPLSRNLRHPQVDPATGECEREAERLARCVAPLGAIDLGDPSSWDLHLLPDERLTADTALECLSGRDFIALNIGGRSQRKHWEDANWRSVLRLLAEERPELAIVCFGAGDEADRSAAVLGAWPGAKANLCGRLSPRESAAAMRRAVLYLGHDSGPMHLAAAVGLPCVALFGDFNRPKRWHPIGAQHRILHDMGGISEISPERVCGELGAA